MLNKRQSKILVFHLFHSPGPAAASENIKNLSKFAFSQILNLYPHNLRKSDNFIFPQHL